MPNYVYCAFSAVGDQNEIERFRNMMFRTVQPDESTGSTREQIFLDFDAVLPIPPEFQDRGSEVWAAHHWGSKWPGFDVYMKESEEGSLGFQFTTAWNFPTLAFQAIAAEFPGLVFSGSAYEENHEFELMGEFNGANNWGEGKIQWT